SQNVTGLSFQWHDASGPIDGATEDSYTTPVLTSSNSYFVTVTCSGSGLSASSNVVAITVNSPEVTSTEDALVCGIGSATLEATGSAGATLAWYADQSGGTALATGNTFETPEVSETTT